MRPTDALGILMILALVVYLGYHLWLSTFDIDSEKMYDDMILREYESEVSSGQVPTAADSAADTGQDNL